MLNCNKKEMKKVISAVLSATLIVGSIFCLSACGDKETKKAEETAANTEQLQECKDFILTADAVLNDYFSVNANPDLNISETVGSMKGKEVVVYPKHNFKIVENRNNYFYTRSALQSEMYRRGNIIFDNYVGFVRDDKHNDKKDLRITENSTFKMLTVDEMKEKYSLDINEISKYYASAQGEKEKNLVYVLVSLSSEQKTMSTYSTIFELEVINNNGNTIYYINNEYLIKDGSFDFEQTKVVRPVSLIENYNNAYVKREMDIIRGINNVAPVETPSETTEE